eukprot:5699617-Amphidinium_carterae.1
MLARVKAVQNSDLSSVASELAMCIIANTEMPASSKGMVDKLSESRYPFVAPVALSVTYDSLMRMPTTRHPSSSLAPLSP